MLILLWQNAMSLSYYMRLEHTLLPTVDRTCVVLLLHRKEQAIGSDGALVWVCIELFQCLYSYLPRAT